MRSTVALKSSLSKQVGARPVTAKESSTALSNTSAERPVERCPVNTSAGPWRSNTSFSLSTETANKGRSYKKRLAGLKQTLYGFQKIQRSGRPEATSAQNEVVNMCLTSTQTKRQSMCQRSRCFPDQRAFVSHSLHAMLPGCLANSHCGTQAIGRETHTENDELWADQLRSAACCLLGACDGLEAQSILNQLVQEPDAVLAKSDLNSCFCSLCKTSLSMMAYKVSRWQTRSKSQQSAGQHHQCVCWLSKCCTFPQ